MPLRTARPRPIQPYRAHPSPHRPDQAARKAVPSGRPQKPPILSALTNLATLSGGTPPAQGQQQQEQPGAAWESDPVLQQIKALQQGNVASAEASALAARQQALINFGYSPELDPLYGDTGTAGSAKTNPFSVLAQLQHSHELRQKNLNENLNKANLFYSGYRGTQLGEEGRSYLGEQAGARSALESQLGGISEGLLGARQTAQEATTGGEQDAYNRWLNQQLQYGLGATGAASQVTGPRQTMLAPSRLATRNRLLRRF